MVSKKTMLIPLLASGLFASVPVMAAGPSGAALGGTCAACHGYQGNSVGIMPSIAGMTEENFNDTMKAFKSGERKATIMDRVAKGYSDEEIARMAAYFSKQKSVPQKQSYDSGLAAQGSGLHEEYCEKCHEDNGRNNEEGAILAGQSKLYLTHSMADFKAKHRDTPKKMSKKVKAMVDKHGAGSIEAVLNFYASQQ